MGDCKSSGPSLQVEEEEEKEEEDLIADLIASAQHIVRALVSRRNFTRNSRKTMADLGARLCSMGEIIENKNGEEDENKNGEEDGISEIQERLTAVQNQVMKWEVDESMIWDCGSKEVSEFMKAVDEARKLTEALESLCLSRDSEESELLGKAHDVMKMVMVRLEKEFGHILVKNRQSFKPDASYWSSEEDVETEGSIISSGYDSVEDPFKHLLDQNRQPFEPEHLSFRPSEVYVGNEESMIASGDESVEDLIQRDSPSRSSSADYVIDVVYPSVIPDLKCIAKMMLDLNCDQECTQAFISVQKDALDNCLHVLAAEEFIVEDVLKMERGKSLARKIKRWIKAMKIFVRVHLASEKRLSDVIFGDFALYSSVCFVEASKSSMLQLLKFGEVIAIWSPHEPDMILRTLSMYEVLIDLIPDIDALYTDELESDVRNKCKNVLRQLGCCVKANFLDLEYNVSVAPPISTTPFLCGGIHPLTRYIVDFIIKLTDYAETINSILKDYVEENAVLFSSHLNHTVEDNASGRSSLCVSPMALHFGLLLSNLESNLDDKSNLCKDDSLGHLFLMNNIHYVTRKVDGSELRTILGEEWIRKNTWKIQQHALSYERDTWSSILCLLSSASSTKSLLRQRIQNFYVAFREVYNRQTGWVIPDAELRNDLQISTSIKVILAYRAFVRRRRVDLGYKNIKYSAEDLENFLLDLFEGSPRSLHGDQRK